MRERRGAVRAVIAAVSLGLPKAILAGALLFAAIFLAIGEAGAHEDDEPQSVTEAPAPTSGAELGYFAKPQYIGNAYCYACHLDLANEFARTKMGRRFLLDPQTDLERRGCEGCHGPGSNHAILGGGAGVGSLIEFRLAPGQSIEAANRVCLDCHNDMFWHARTRGAQELACFDCHLVMQHMSPDAQLMPPWVKPWNNARNWSAAGAGGIFLGLLTGLIFRRRKPGDRS